jgi:hypothetical protein
MSFPRRRESRPIGLRVPASVVLAEKAGVDTRHFNNSVLALARGMVFAIGSSTSSIKNTFIKNIFEKEVPRGPTGRPTLRPIIRAGGLPDV